MLPWTAGILARIMGCAETKKAEDAGGTPAVRLSLTTFDN